MKPRSAGPVVAGVISVVMVSSLWAGSAAGIIPQPSRSTETAKQRPETAGRGSAPAVRADEKTVNLVREFLKKKTAQLPVSDIPEFVSIDPPTLPAGLRPKYIARREELLALKRLAAAKKKAGLRRLGQEELPRSACPAPIEMDDPRTMRGFGFEEISDQEEIYLMQQTRCSECELIKEFSLTPVRKKDATASVGAPEGGSKPAERRRGRPRYFLHENDPLLLLVYAYRQGRSAFGTNFFGVGHPACR